MADFSHLKALDISGATTREYVFSQIEGDPSVICAPLDDCNEAVLNTRLKMAIEQSEARAAEPRGKVAKEKTTPESVAKSIEEDRDWDRRLLAEACIHSWGNPPVDSKGKVVAFSKENAHDFLCALPTYILTPFITWARNVYNFKPSIPLAKEVEQLGN